MVQDAYAIFTADAAPMPPAPTPPRCPRADAPRSPPRRSRPTVDHSRIYRTAVEQSAYLPGSRAGQVEPDEPGRHRGSPDDPAVHVAGAACPPRSAATSRARGRRDRVGVQVEAAEAGSRHLSRDVRRRMRRAHRHDDVRPFDQPGEASRRQARRLGPRAGRRAASLRYPQHLVARPGQALSHRRAHLTRVQQPDREVTHAPYLTRRRNRARPRPSARAALAPVGCGPYRSPGGYPMPAGHDFGPVACTPLHR